MKRTISTLFALFFLMSISVAQACDCPAPLPHMDQDVLSRIDVAARVLVIEHKTPIWNEPAPHNNVYRVHVEDVYYGTLAEKGLDASGIMSIMEDATNGCSRYLAVDHAYDLLLIHDSGKYRVSGQCTELSSEMWSRFKTAPRSKVWSVK